ncbi:tRNA lysidine(34) synthetase TilS [Thalassotalea sp. G2M2-11]|uniref:tRNA lysidine(34) synthetase TilS n=1 Tax=Thalassotalea sp. G2M2-11 TaxID=2787627 RepID=UPI0019CFEACA|nr:tRNA lysidine(34) synthetase TilS [Thalassotalea sp. G2M2-11]
MSLITDTLLAFFSAYPKQPIVVAYSGGVDSQVLLHALASLKKQDLLNNKLSACHVNHGLSQHADKWHQFAIEQCQSLDIPLVDTKLTLDKKPQQSLEAIAREARYHTLEKLCQAKALICTGHHQDDQVETFFLALKRGSGVKGLSSMADHMPLGEKEQVLVRPLLDCTRQDIVNYAQTHQLTWVDDESNADVSFDRNFIRHELIPLLQQRWPSIRQTVARSATHCQQAQQLLDECAKEDLATCLNTDNTLNVIALKKYSRVRFDYIVREFLSQHNALMPSTAQLAQLYQQVFSNNSSQAAVKVGQLWLRKYQQKLYLTPSYQVLDDWGVSIDLSFDSSKSLAVELPDGLGEIHFSLASSSVELGDGAQCFALPEGLHHIRVCFRHHNPRCHPDYRQHSRPLKKVLQELALPPWQRVRLPLLFCEQELVAALGQFVCRPFIAKNEQRNIIVRWLTNQQSG